MMQQVDLGVTALAEGRAFADLSAYRKVRVTGSEATSWLHDLLTADIEGIGPGHASRSLLLSATGRIRADVHAARTEDELLLVQAADQPEHIGLALAPYVLSADVQLEDATATLALFAIPGEGASRVGLPGTSPSVLGPGVDLTVGAGKAAWRCEESLIRADLVEADADALERWRIVRGIPRMGADFSQGALPAEAGLGSTIDWTKGCFLGQESVAKIRNLGRPTWTVLPCSFLGSADPGDAVLVAGGEVGYLTSVAAGVPRSAAIARIRWESRDEILTLPDGRLIVVPQPG